MATKKKQRKIEVQREFKSEWTENYAFVLNSIGIPTCLICNDKVVNNIKSNIERHFLTKHDAFGKMYPAGDDRKKAVMAIQQKMKQSTTAASFAVSEEIAKNGKPFTDGEYIKRSFLVMAEYLFSDFKNKNEILKKIADTPLSAKTVHERTINMAADLSNRQFEDLNMSTGFSLACDESYDINNTAQVSLLVRYVTTSCIREELLALLPLKEQTRGQDICAAIVDIFNKNDIDLNKVVSVSTDGAPNMVDENNGFTALFKQHINHDIFTFHCILHQEALCAQTFSLEIVKVMDLVVKIVNQIIAKGLYHKQFCSFLKELNAQYTNLIPRNTVHWLSRGAVLTRFAECIEYVKQFLIEKDLMYPELNNHEWLHKFYFIVDMTAHLKHLNIKLQGRGQTANSLLAAVLSFEKHFELFEKDMKNGSLIHFESLKCYLKETSSKIDAPFFVKTIEEMKNSFANRFKDFKNQKATHSFLKNPLEVDTENLNLSPFPNINRGQFELQLANLKTNDLWSSKFSILKTELEDLERNKANLAMAHKWSEISKCNREDQIIFEAWSILPDCYQELKTFAFGLLTVFGSTYSCEQSFSNMDLFKNKDRNQLDNITLESCLKLKISEYRPKLRELCEVMPKSN